MIKSFQPDCINLFGRELANDPKEGTPFCRETLGAVTSDDFAAWFKDKIAQLSGKAGNAIFTEGEEPPLPDAPFETEKCFCDPPKSEMQRMREIWRPLSPNEASSSALWGYINVRMIERKLVPAPFFAGDAHKTDSGARLIEKALRDNDEASIRRLAWSVSRFLTGYIPARSVRPLYQNCPPARAWWLCHIAEKAAQSGCFPSAGIDRVFAVLKEKSVWPHLTECAVSKLTVVGDINIRHGIIGFLCAKDGEQAGKRFRSLLKGIGEMSSWRALGSLPPKRISEIVRLEIDPYTIEAPPDNSEDENEDAI